MAPAIRVDAGETEGDLTRFWHSTGFTPAKLLLDPDARQSMALLGSIPNDGVRYVRVHYLLDLVRIADVDTKEPTYDWTDLDRALDALVENGLEPYFELMGYPSVSDYFTDFHDDEQVRAWKRFVRDLADHYVERYGRAEVESWRFETWNEPDIPGHWDRFDFARDHEAFCNYYDACSEGLAAATGEFRLGGPGTATTLSPLFESFVAHCDDGENYFTGETGVRLDFVSVHEKGVSPHPEDLTPDTDDIVDRELDAYEYVAENHPRLADVPVMNNECDPQTGWADTHTWRAKPYYPALVAKIVDQHVDRIVDGSDHEYELLSSDNGFLGTWGQRTQFARFGEGGFEGTSFDPNRAVERERVDAFEFVKKPIHGLMTLLSLLGDERIETQTSGATDDVHVLATRRRDPEQVAVLLAHVRDDPASSGDASIDVDFDTLPFEEGALARYRLDEAHCNPYRIWEHEQGFPDEPTGEQLAALRREAEPSAIEIREDAVEDGAISVDVDLPLPGVELLHLAEKPASAPDAVEGLQAETYRGMNVVEDEVLLSWNDLPTRTARTYEVLYSEHEDGPFERVNEVDQLANAYLHVRDPASDLPDEKGYYAVRAVDHWGQTGERSNVVAK